MSGSSIVPRLEAQHAAAWWTTQLGCTEQDNGDAMGSAFASLVARRINRPLTPAQVTAYRVHLAETIEDHLRQWETGIWDGAWSPAEPSRGSALRAILCDYGPDQVLTDAADRCGVKIGRLMFPIKTVMWINPGCVKVRSGYDAGVEEVYSEQRVQKVSRDR